MRRRRRPCAAARSEEPYACRWPRSRRRVPPRWWRWPRLLERVLAVAAATEARAGALVGELVSVLLSSCKAAAQQQSAQQEQWHAEAVQAAIKATQEQEQQRGASQLAAALENHCPLVLAETEAAATPEDETVPARAQPQQNPTVEPTNTVPSRATEDFAEVD